MKNTQKPIQNLETLKPLNIEKTIKHKPKNK